ncbi:MAG: V-type ATP synthase subunit K [Kiritimatiellae bacterium]|nr:V-type ATP synthase subunit K [Kiritimatiellia bacterium]
MEEAMNISLGKLGAMGALCFAAIGSAMGTGAAGAAAIGAWKRCYAQGKAAPIKLITFVGAPLSQTIYGMILLFVINGKASEGVAYPALLGGGMIAGIAMGFSAWLQGKAGAGGSVALAETGEGFTNYLTALGVIETVAIFVMVLTMIVL